LQLKGKAARRRYRSYEEDADHLRTNSTVACTWSDPKVAQRW
jgi:hypothetical protein